MTKEALVKEILEETNGKAVYSEQISLILNKVIGLSLKEVHELDTSFTVHHYYHHKSLDLGLEEVLSWEQFQSKLKNIANGNPFIENFLLETFSLDRKDNFQSKIFTLLNGLSPEEVFDCFMFLTDGKLESLEEMRLMLTEMLPAMRLQFLNLFEDVNKESLPSEIFKLVDKSSLSFYLRERVKTTVSDSFFSMSNRDYTVFTTMVYEKTKGISKFNFSAHKRDIDESEIQVSDKDGMLFEMLIPYHILEDYKKTLDIKVKKDGLLERKDKEIIIRHLMDRNIIPEGIVMGSISGIPLETKFKVSTIILTADKVDQVMKEMSPSTGL